MNKLFGTDGFMPRGSCGQTPGLLLAYNVADLMVFLAYIAIPISLLYFYRLRFKFNWLIPPQMLVWYATFIVFCGSAHLSDMLMTWWPAYYFACFLHWLTAFASWGCAISTWFATKGVKL